MTSLSPTALRRLPLPPLLTAATLIGQAMLARPARLSRLRSGVASALFGGWLCVAVASALQFRRYETTIEPMHPEDSTSLIVTGPFARSRNPLYLAMVGVSFANALRLGRLAGVAPTLALFSWFNHVQVPREEQAMSRLFGEHFTTYCARVRRWI